MNSIDDTELCFSVRVIGVRSDLVQKFNENYSEILHSVCPYFKDKSLSVVSIQLDDETDLELVSIALSIFNDKCLSTDIFISVSSDVDTQILDFPKFATDAIRLLSVNISLSYTIFSDAD